MFWFGHYRGVGEGAGGCYLGSQNVVCMYVSGRWPNVEGKPATANDWITCNFKPLRSHTFVNFLF